MDDICGIVAGISSLIILLFGYIKNDKIKKYIVSLGIVVFCVSFFYWIEFKGYKDLPLNLNKYLFVPVIALCLFNLGFKFNRTIRSKKI